MSETVLEGHPHPGTPPGQDVYDQLAVVLRDERVSAAARLALIVRACAEEDLCVQDLLDDDPAPDAALGWDGAERWVQVGADGTPRVAEFVVLNLQALVGCSVQGMRARMADALNLRHRHPCLWEAVQDLTVEAWQAMVVVTECVRAGLGGQEAMQVDEWLAEGIALLGWARARRLLKGLIVRVDPALAAERAAKRREQRGVWSSSIEDGCVTVEARLDGVDGLALEAQVARIARHLAADARAEGGEPDPLGHRRARALAMLATPHLAAAYLEDHEGTGERSAPRIDPDKLRPQVKLYLHLHADDVRLPEGGSGVVRLEKHDPVTVASLRDLLRGSVVRVHPVVDLNRPPVTDAYEVPDRLREHVVFRNPYDLMPWSGTGSRECDLDHTEEYDFDDWEGREQTSAENLGPLGRTGHRGKTHAGFDWEQLKPGVFWYTTEAGFQYLVTPNGTMPMGRHPDARRTPSQPAPATRPVTEMREGPAMPPPPPPHLEGVGEDPPF